MDITSNEMRFVLKVFKNPEIDFNASSMAKEIGLSPMGALKIAKRLEKENVLLPRKLGRAVFYRINLGNDYARQYIRFLLKREAEQSDPYIRRWVNELKKIRNADAAVLFGSVLMKGKYARDIDVLLVTGEDRFQGLKKEIDEINGINIKQLHPMYQTREDVRRNIGKGDKPLLNAIKGIVIFGEDIILNLLKK